MFTEFDEERCMTDRKSMNQI